MSSKDIDKQVAYIEARMRARYVCSIYCLPFWEWQIDVIKEFLLRLCENDIERSQMVDKVGEKNRLSEWYDVSAQGIKDELCSMGRLIKS